MFRSESGLHASCSSCLRLNDLVWLQGHWNRRYAVLGSILASHGGVFYNFLVRRRESFDSKLAPGNFTFMSSLWSPYLIFIAMICELRGGNEVPFMKRSRAVAPTLIFCYLWGDPVGKKITWFNWNCVFLLLLLFILCYWLIYVDYWNVSSLFLPLQRTRISSARRADRNFHVLGDCIRSLY